MHKMLSRIVSMFLLAGVGFHVSASGTILEICNLTSQESLFVNDGNNYQDLYTIEGGCTKNLNFGERTKIELYNGPGIVYCDLDPAKGIAVSCNLATGIQLAATIMRNGTMISCTDTPPPHAHASTK